MPLTQKEKKKYAEYQDLMRGVGRPCRSAQAWVKTYRIQQKRQSQTGKRESCQCSSCHVSFAWSESPNGLCYWCENDQAIHPSSRKAS